MEYRILGKTGLKISRMGFGGIPIQRIDAERTKALMHKLLENGVNYIDTARGYTVSEEYLGVGLEGIREHWWENDRFTAAGVREEAQWVWDGLDSLLARHGYRREGEYYRAERSNEDTVILFCHFGVTCVLLSHLLGISPMVLWHGVCSLPTSVTVLNTEERREGIASFRMSAFGDTSHLYAAGREPSFSGRFCETYENWEQRHD